MYAAPDSKSLRGAKGRARVSTNGWIQVFGSEGDWILVQYDITVAGFETTDRRDFFDLAIGNVPFRCV